MLRGLFVTGTDTGVGKTIVAAALMHRYRLRSDGPVSDTCLTPLRYWKPVQTGIEIDDDTREAGRLGECAQDELLASGIRLRHPVSPHLAARRAGQAIDLDVVLDIVLAEPPARWIVEGAGGVLVPIDGAHTMAHLMVRLALGVVVVARTTLGTINHTLLTIEALRARSLTVAGVLMVGPPNADNRDAIEAHGRVRVLGEMPAFDPLTPDALRRWAVAGLDPEGHLLEYFR